MRRAQVIQSLIDLYEEPAYLEIGVNEGRTFREVKVRRKVAVDPLFLFDWEAMAVVDPTAVFHQVESDHYFSDHLGTDLFEVIYLDGLHTFEQTFRDFTNALNCLRDDGVIVVDDVMPNSYQASLPDLHVAQMITTAIKSPDQSWMGDVYKLVFFIQTFYPSLSYSCIKENHGQMVVWREHRSTRVPQRRVAEVGALPYEAVITQSDVFRWRAFAEIREDVKQRNFRLQASVDPTDRSAGRFGITA